MAQLREIAAFLDEQLKSGFTDSSNNGLQVENSGQVSHVCGGVDASLPFFKAAARRGADLVIVHHGLSWRDSLKYITDLNYRRLALLVRNDMAVYASHLPLDGHATLGNNVQLFKLLGIRKLRGFCNYNGQTIGMQGELPRPMRLKDFAALVSRTVGNGRVQVFDYGKPMVKTLAGVVGGGAVGFDEAARAGIDVYLSGEPNLGVRNTAEEWGMNAVFAGHYATEKFGVQALLKVIGRKFRVKTEFIDLKVEN